MKKLLSALVLMFILQSCSEKLEFTDFANKNWVLTTWGERVLPTEKATLHISAKETAYGKSFCNNYGGKFIVLAKNVKFSDLFSTKMYCENVAEAESKYLNDLKSINGAKINNGKLELLKDDKIVMVFTATN